MSWARGALDRNEHLQVVASDPQARTFTVRMKGSGELRVIPLEQIVAGPVGGGQGEGTSPSATAPVSAGAGEPAAGASATPSTAATQATAANSSARGNGDLASTGEPARAAADDSSSSAEVAQPSDSSSEASPPHAEAAADAKAGRVLASGPGYSIKASGPKSSSTRSAAVTPARTHGLPIEQLHDPIICQGSRLLHIDNRNLQFDGDAVSAEDGCEIHITNTHISAKGVGVLARAANVHIENSEIEGDSGAIDASEGAQVYAESSTFKGLTRRMESSAFHDLGGNVWN
jgi:hypothetical protein